MSDRDPLKTATQALGVADVGLTLAERVAAFFGRGKAKRTTARIARLRGRAAKLQEKAKRAKPARAGTLLAAAAGATAEADALERGTAVCAEP